MNSLYLCNKNKFNKITSAIDSVSSRLDNSRILLTNHVSTVKFCDTFNIQTTVTFIIKDTKVFIEEGSHGDIFWCFDISPENFEILKFKFIFQNNHVEIDVESKKNKTIIKRAAMMISEDIILHCYETTKDYDLEELRMTQKNRVREEREKAVYESNLFKDIEKQLYSFMNGLEFDSERVRLPQNIMKDKHKLPIIQMVDTGEEFIYNVNRFGIEEFKRKLGVRNRLSLSESALFRDIKKVVANTITSMSYKYWLRMNIYHPDFSIRGGIFL